MPVYAVANQKGGVGKTTTAVNLAFSLKYRNLSVLLIDCDPQASATIYLGQDPRQLDVERRTLQYSLLRGANIRDSIVLIRHIGLIPSSITLSAADSELLGEPFSASVLKEVIKPILSEFDAIIIDCPPTLSMLTINALTAANRVIVPVKTEFLDIMGIPLLFDIVDKIKRRGNSELEIVGVLPTMYNQRFNQDQQTLEELRTTLRSKIHVFDPIPRSTSFGQSAARGKAVLESRPESKASAVYQALADWLIRYEQEK